MTAHRPEATQGSTREERGRTWVRALLDFFLRRGPCLECRGTGMANAGQTCPRCGGRGRPA